MFDFDVSVEILRIKLYQGRDKLPSWLFLKQYQNDFSLFNKFSSISRRKQIEEISNNIQEARRIFELLESETRRLALVCFKIRLNFKPSVFYRVKKMKTSIKNHVLHYKFLNLILSMKSSIMKSKNVRKKLI